MVLASWPLVCGVLRTSIFCCLSSVWNCWVRESTVWCCSDDILMIFCSISTCYQTPRRQWRHSWCLEVVVGFMRTSYLNRGAFYGLGPSPRRWCFTWSRSGSVSLESTGLQFLVPVLLLKPQFSPVGNISLWQIRQHSQILFSGDWWFYLITSRMDYYIMNLFYLIQSADCDLKTLSSLGPG